MKIFVYEHVTGGGLAGAPLPQSLAREGEAMLRALARDLAGVRGVEIVTCRDSRFPPIEFPRVFECERCLREADAVWPIAPETDSALENISRKILNRGKILLGSEPETVHIAASKLETSRVLAEAGIAVAPTYHPEDRLPDSDTGWIVKPDDGAGCLDTLLFFSRAEAMRHAHISKHVVQPFVLGEPCSLSLLCRRGEARLLSCNHQRIEINDGTVQFLGCDVACVSDETGVLSKLASRIGRALPGLWGYCGVDFVKTENGPVIIEINPRLTASYAGLSDALGKNVAGMVLDLCHLKP
ncbi:MAG TPA: ATP-grasp domain-containing protein [Burkholderiales bacterium]|nr:ATP-grasp domain-containing protein [Burkholderiales bacterium]